jgi:pyrimidine deaminase RibD-like protein
MVVYSKECAKHINLLRGKNAEIINVTAVGVYNNHCVAEGVSDERKTQHADKCQAEMKYDIKIPVTRAVSYIPSAQNSQSGKTLEL